MTTRKTASKGGRKRIRTKRGGTLIAGNVAGEGRLGRPPGAANKTTRIVKEALLLAAETVGMPQVHVRRIKDELITSLKATGKDGLLGYLTHVALTDTKAFCALLGRVLPMQIQGNVNIDGTVTHKHEETKKSAEELRQELLRRGVPPNMIPPRLRPPTVIDNDSGEDVTEH